VVATISVDITVIWSTVEGSGPTEDECRRRDVATFRIRMLLAVNTLLQLLTTTSRQHAYHLFADANMDDFVALRERGAHGGITRIASVVWCANRFRTSGCISTFIAPWSSLLRVPHI
jgi:hypothetical protein